MLAHNATNVPPTTTDYPLVTPRKRQRLHRGPRVEYSAIDRRRAAPDTMQPMVREVYETLVEHGPLLLAEIIARTGLVRNTVRFAVQVLRQAGLVDSEKLARRARTR
jgi:DNA-binding transcriptional ArsR family regulator